MLLYLGGVAAVSQTKGLEVAEKRQRLEELFAMSETIARLQSIFGAAMDKPLARYGCFLEQLDNADIRAQLKLPGEQGLQSVAYQELSDEARAFKKDLLDMLMDGFGAEHDVIKALLL